MGDRCYMQVTCRRQDESTFEALGFHLEFEQSPDCPIIEMIDEEANYAHSGYLPTEVPFLASHGAGGNYGEGKIACDGNSYAEVEAGHDGGFVVHWDDTAHQPTSECIAGIRDYLAVRQSAQEMFLKLSVSPPPAHRPDREDHLFHATTRRCVHCGQHADDDAVEPTLCRPLNAP